MEHMNGLERAEGTGRMDRMERREWSLAGCSKTEDTACV